MNHLQVGIFNKFDLVYFSILFHFSPIHSSTHVFGVVQYLSNLLTFKGNQYGDMASGTRTADNKRQLTSYFDIKQKFVK
jgi:hypothetical protein